MAESVTGLLQLGGNHALTGAREFTCALVAEQSRTQRRDRQHRWSAQDMRERASVVDVANRFWGNRIHRPGQGGVPQPTVVGVDEIIDPDPGQPLPAIADPAAEAGAEQRSQ